MREKESKIILAIVESIRNIETDEPIYSGINGNELVSIRREDMEKGKPLTMVRNYGDEAKSKTDIEAVFRVGDTITIYTEDAVFTLRAKWS